MSREIARMVAARTQRSGEAIQLALIPLGSGRVPYALCHRCQRWYHPLVGHRHA